MAENRSVTNLIIGAGPAGMACAMELYRAGKKAVIIEKSDAVGGLAKTLQFGKFRTDIGPHRFYSKNAYLYSFIEDLLGEDWILVDRYTRFFIDGKFFMYPVEWKNVMQNIGMLKVGRALFDYVWAKFQYWGKEPDNFKDYVIANFGRTIADLNMIGYTEKIWGIPSEEISVDQAKQRIKKLSLMNLLKTLLQTDSNKEGPKSLVNQFYYPSKGSGLIYEV